MRPKCSLTLITFGALILVVTFSSLSMAWGKAKPRRRIIRDFTDGIYKSVTSLDNPKFHAYLKALGFSEDFVKSFGPGESITIKLGGWDNETDERSIQYSTTAAGGKSVHLRFELLNDFQGEILDGRTFKQTISPRWDFQYERDIFMDGFEVAQSAIVNDDGNMELRLEANGRKTTLIFRK